MTQMTTIGTPQMSDYDDRIFVIEVTGVCRQDVKRVSTYKKKVAHSRMNEAMREIYSLGGKVVSVTLLGESQANNQPVKTDVPLKEESQANNQPVKTDVPLKEESQANNQPVKTDVPLNEELQTNNKSKLKSGKRRKKK